jgi:hypothetical protein
MAKQDGERPARRPKDALLMRSADSIGRTIGTLQRQIDKPVARRRTTAARRTARKK